MIDYAAERERKDEIKRLRNMLVVAREDCEVTLDHLVKVHARNAGHELAVAVADTVARHKLVMHLRKRLKEAGSHE